MNNADLLKMDDEWVKLLLKRGLLEIRNFKSKSRSSEVRGELTFLQHTKAQSWYYHTLYNQGFEILKILNDDSKLVSSNVLKNNIQADMNKLIPIGLEDNKGWSHLANSLIEFTSKGVGLGELFLPLVIQGYTKSKSQSVGDGEVNGGKSEVKKKGAGIKSQPDTQRKVQNKLNKTVFEGHDPGPATTGWYKWREWMDSLPVKTQQSKLREYFTELYVDTSRYEASRCEELRQDIDSMCTALELVRDGQEFGHVIGTYQLKWYQQMDGWRNLIVIDNKHKQFINIVDVHDLSMFPNLRFDWRYRRSSDEGGDTYQCGDGFVTIGITSPEKIKSEKKLPSCFVEETEEERLAKIAKSQEMANTEINFSNFIQDPTDPLYPVWHRISKDDIVEAHDIVLEEMQKGKANAEIATTLVECFLN